MSRRFLAGCAAAFSLTLSAALGIALATPAGAAGSLTPVPQGFVGMVIDGPTWHDSDVNLPGQLGTMVSSGVESIRAEFDWAAAQPYRTWAQVPSAERSQFVNVGGVPTNFTNYDTLVAGAAQRRLTVLPTIENAPSWDGQTYPGGIVALPRSPGPYAAFARALVLRYGSKGTFWRANPGLPKLPITMWQVWNEPNITAFWPPQPYYRRYVTLLRAAHAAIKAADPAAKVVLAGLPNYSWVELARINAFRGGRNLYDVVAVHPYTKTPQGVITIIRYVRHELDISGGARKPIVADEISWPSSAGKTIHDTGYDFATTEAGQARDVAAAMRLLEQNRVRLGIGGFYYFDWAGQDRSNYLAFDFSGLFHFAGGQFQPKPAYSVFRRAALAMEGCRAKRGTASDCVR